MSPTTTPCDLIIIGASARAAARSAIGAGYRPWCVDLFADLDLRRIASVYQCPHNLYPDGLVEMVKAAPVRPESPVLITGALENRPDVLEAIEIHRPLLGSCPRAIRAVRSPNTLERLAACPGLSVCCISRSIPRSPEHEHSASRDRPRASFLVKPLAGAGERHIEFQRVGRPLAPNTYAQRYIPGQPVSAVYRSDLTPHPLIGVTEQLIGEPAFGARHFHYCGSIGPRVLTSAQHNALNHLGSALVKKYELQDLFGVDAIIDEAGRIWPVEVNPRYTASVEILERAMGQPVISPRAGEGDEGLRDLLGPRSVPARTGGPVHGKAIIFARADGHAPDLLRVFNHYDIADIPPPGSIIRAGGPVCTLLTRANDRDACMTKLRAMAIRLHERT